MSYGDGLILIGAYEQTDGTGEGIEAINVEVNADDAAQDIWQWRCPYKVQVEAFALVITEIGAAAATDAVASLDVIANDAAGTRTEKLTLSLDATLYSKGDGDKASVTPMTTDADWTVGTVLLYTGVDLPFTLLQGEILVAEHKTAGDGATLAYQVVALVRVDGYDQTALNVATLDAAR